MSKDYKKHFILVQRGLAWHEKRQYGKALPFFESALVLCTDCPNAKYNLANTLHMLNRNEEARSILLDLVKTSESVLRSMCPDAAESPRSLCLDAFHLLFLTTLYATDSWSKALPYLREHLRRRTRGLNSIWSKAALIRDAEELREEFAPRAKSVLDWAV